jgi:AcrR family transcriptional regulator
LPTRARVLHDEITRAAAACFAETGYRATNLETVAARVGVSKVTLYRYVSSKEALPWRVFERTIESSRLGLRQIVEQEGPADEKLRCIIHYQVRLVASHLPFLAVFFSEGSGLPHDLARRIASAKRQYDRAIERVVQDGIAEGRFRDLPPTLVVFALLGMCNWLSKWYRPDGPLTQEQIADVFADLLARGYLRPVASEGDDGAAALRRIEAQLAALKRQLQGLGVRRAESANTRRSKAGRQVLQADRGLPSAQ